MSLLSTIQHCFGFTRNEIKVILVLAGTFVAGIGVRWYQSDFKAKSLPLQRFDYSRSDSIFNARSGISRTVEQSRGSSIAPLHPGKNLPPGKDSRPVNINTASKGELMRLPGIGPAFADRILLYRQQHGRFASVDDLRKVSGIGKKKMERLRARVKLD